MFGFFQTANSNKMSAQQKGAPKGADAGQRFPASASDLNLNLSVISPETETIPLKDLAPSSLSSSLPLEPSTVKGGRPLSLMLEDLMDELVSNVETNKPENEITAIQEPKTVEKNFFVYPEVPLACRTFRRCSLNGARHRQVAGKLGGDHSANLGAIGEGRAVRGCCFPYLPLKEEQEPGKGSQESIAILERFRSGRSSLRRNGTIKDLPNAPSSFVEALATIPAPNSSPRKRSWSTGSLRIGNLEIRPFFNVGQRLRAMSHCFGGSSLATKRSQSAPVGSVGSSGDSVYPRLNPPIPYYNSLFGSEKPLVPRAPTFK